mgnify:CR=1 FL=1
MIKKERETKKKPVIIASPKKGRKEKTLTDEQLRSKTHEFKALIKRGVFLGIE